MLVTTRLELSELYEQIGAGTQDVRAKQTTSKAVSTKDAKMSTENPIPTVYDDSPIADTSISGDSESYSVLNNLPAWLIDNIYAIHNHPWVVPCPD